MLNFTQVETFEVTHFVDENSYPLVSYCFREISKKVKYEIQKSFYEYKRHGQNVTDSKRKTIKIYSCFWVKDRPIQTRLA